MFKYTYTNVEYTMRYYMRILNNRVHNIAPVRMSGVQKSNNIVF